MSYVPNLLPESSRVDLGLNYDDPGKNFRKKKSSYWLAFSYLSASVAGIGSVATIFTRPGQGIILLCLALLLLPPVHFMLERKLRFRFTWIIKSFLCILLLFSVLGVSVAYDKKEKQQAILEKSEKEKQDAINEKSRTEAAKREKIRTDSLGLYLSKADNELGKHKYTEGITFLDKALNFATAKEEDSIRQKRADSYYKAGKYTAATEEYTHLVLEDYRQPQNLYQRALCYHQLKRKAEAVADLKNAIKLGNKDAEELHNKLNPIKRRITGYVTRCCDGSISSSAGSGTCSHHGGVCDWKEPQYEEYREY